jgi:hypothetical protein
MTDISVEEVFTAVKEMLAGTNEEVKDGNQ